MYRLHAGIAIPFDCCRSFENRMFAFMWRWYEIIAIECDLGLDDHLPLLQYTYDYDARSIEHEWKNWIIQSPSECRIHVFSIVDVHRCNASMRPTLLCLLMMMIGYYMKDTMRIDCHNIDSYTIIEILKHILFFKNGRKINHAFPTKI